VIDLSTIDVQQLQADSATLIGRIYLRLLEEGPGIEQPFLDELIEKVVDEEIEREIENRLPSKRARSFAKNVIVEGHRDTLCQEMKKVVAGYQFQEQLRRLSGPPN